MRLPTVRFAPEICATVIDLNFAGVTNGMAIEPVRDQAALATALSHADDLASGFATCVVVTLHRHPVLAGASCAI